MPPFFPLVFVLSKICPGHKKKCAQHKFQERTGLQEVRNAKGGGSVLMLYQNVKPMFGAQNPFDLEAVTSIAKCHEFNMGDKKPRLIVGTVAHSADGNGITLLAERIFPLEPADAKFFYKEMEQLHSTLSGDRIEAVAKKRPADDLVNDTPHKMRQRQL